MLQTVSRPQPSDVHPEGDVEARWQALVLQVGSEIASPLTAALERIHLLTATGKIDRAGLRALRDEVDRARQAGIVSQQLARFASGRVKQSHEVLQLEEVLKNVLQLRARETQARGIELRPQLKSARVIVDGSLLYSLLNGMLDWALANAQARIELTIDFRPWPVHARLGCRFPHRPADQPDTSVTALTLPQLDSLTWRLVEQTAWTMGLAVERRDHAGMTELVLEFPKTAGDEMIGLAVGEGDELPVSTNSKALAGSHVLVVASRRDVRVAIRDALRNMGLLIDFVGSVEEASSFCREGLPHAIVFESILRGARFAAFRDEVLAEVPDFVFVEVLEQGAIVQPSSPDGRSMARVGRDAVASALPATLMLELTKSL
jgi:hypothetical protein